MTDIEKFNEDLIRESVTHGRAAALAGKVRGSIVDPHFMALLSAMVCRAFSEGIPIKVGWTQPAFAGWRHGYDQVMAEKRPGLS